MKKDKDIITTEYPFLDIGVLNRILQSMEPLVFLPPQEFYFKKCNHKFLIISHLSKKGFSAEILNKRSCKDCDKKIEEIIQNIGNPLVKSMEKEIKKWKIKKEGKSDKPIS